MWSDCKWAVIIRGGNQTRWETSLGFFLTSDEKISINLLYFNVVKVVHR